MIQFGSVGTYHFHEGSVPEADDLLERKIKKKDPQRASRPQTSPAVLGV